jgi:hypothetical protein
MISQDFDMPDQPLAPAWRRIAQLQFWLLVFPPVGWWKLWQDTSFSRTAKLRILFYTYLIPMLAYVAFLVFVFNTAQKAIEAAGGGF